MDKDPKGPAGLPEDEFDGIFPDFTEIRDKIKDEWDRWLFDPEDDEDYWDEEETEEEDE